MSGSTGTIFVFVALVPSIAVSQSVLPDARGVFLPLGAGLSAEVSGADTARWIATRGQMDTAPDVHSVDGLALASSARAHRCTPLRGFSRFDRITSGTVPSAMHFRLDLAVGVGVRFGMFRLLPLGPRREDTPVRDDF